MRYKKWYVRVITLISPFVILCGCVEFKSIEQPASVLPGESFTVFIEVTTDDDGEGEPFFGIRLPNGWTISGDAIAYTGVCSGTIIYDSDLALEQESLSPSLDGYYWWAGTGDRVESEGGSAYAEVLVHTNNQTGRFFIDYMVGDAEDTDRSNKRLIEVVDEYTPRELGATVQEDSVILSWSNPVTISGLAGYNVYRDGLLINTGPVNNDEYADGDLAGGVFFYSASAVYESGHEHLTPYEVKALVFSGGTGEPNDPYQIAKAEQLVSIADDPNLLDKHFVLINDVDLDASLPGGQVFDRAIIAPDTDTYDTYWDFHGTPFSGTFDGNGHTVSHLMIVGESYLGLFGKLASGASISNLGLEAVEVNGTGRQVGGLAGSNGDREHAGGVLTNCYSTGTVTGDERVGGLVGYNYNGGSITTSYSTAMVTGNSRVGGLAGCNGDWKNAGGVLTNCYSTGAVTGHGGVGGLVGHNGGSISHSYGIGAVTGDGNAGGLVGSNYDRASITTSYSIGMVTGNGRVGGLVGYNRGNVSNSFWNIQTSGLSESEGGIGLMTVAMQDIDTFLNTGWDFANEVPNGTCDYWQISPGDYPRLRHHTGDGPVMPEGMGTAQQPYLIRDAWDLGTVWFEPQAHFRLASSLDLSGVTWSTSAIPWFGGSFDGNGYVIRHLHIYGAGNLGLFGQLGDEAMISNLGLEAADIHGTGDCIGALVGSNWGGNITSSYSTGTVTGNRDVGGLVGDNNGSVSNSYSAGTVSGDIYVGGLVGENDDGSIAVSYSTGAVTGNGDFGGLVGENNGAVTTSFWDVESSGVSGSDGGVALTTAEMMDPHILGLNGLGDNPHWIVDADRDYPRLSWEGTVGQSINEPDTDWLAGSGSTEDPYCIEKSAQLIRLRKTSILWDRCFLLCADIDLDPNLPGQYVFGQAVIPSFSGFLDGNGHVIFNLWIEGASNLGLFGRLEHGAEVRSLGLAHVNITGTGDYVGGVAGDNKGSITETYSSGTVSGDILVGGLVGRNDGMISASYSAGVVSGDILVGGLAGRNDGMISASYNTGVVSGRWSVGGLTGRDNSRIDSSYSIGAVSGGSNIGGLIGNGDASTTVGFWDMQASGLTRSFGGTGLTTAEMQTASTFLVAGWDFVNETANGTDDIWWILEGQDYPRLWWQQ